MDLVSVLVFLGVLIVAGAFAYREEYREKQISALKRRIEELENGR